MMTNSAGSTNKANGRFPPIWLADHAYDLRGGGVETAIKGSKQGLGITN